MYKRFRRVLGALTVLLLGAFPSISPVQDWVQPAQASSEEIDRYFNYDGTDDVATGGFNLTTNYDFSIEMWLYFDGAADGSYGIFRYGDTSDSHKRRVFAYVERDADGNNELKVGINGNGSHYTTGYYLPDQEWVHFAIVREDSSNWRVDINGAEVFSRVNGFYNIGGNPAPFRIGDQHPTGDHWKGRIDQVKIWDGALTSSEVQTSMSTWDDTGITGKSLLHHYDFNDASTTQVTDQQGTDHLSWSGYPAAGSFGERKTSNTSTSGSNMVLTFPRSILTSTGGWLIPAGVTSIDYLIVGGGGGGAARNGGGGGGGAVVEAFSQSVNQGSSLFISVGTGGAGGPGDPDYSGDVDIRRGQDGANSSLTISGSTTSAAGGKRAGYGEYYDSQIINGGYSGNSYQGGSGITGGLAGAESTGWAAGGGAGAGGTGEGAAAPSGAFLNGSGGSGGQGVSSNITGATVYFGGGGGGGVDAGLRAGTGQHGGGNGGSGGSGHGADGTANTGGGGGGGGYCDSSGTCEAGSAAGGNGGSGVVIIRYSLAPEAPTSVSANAQNGQVKLSWVAPAHTGGSSITDYSIRYRPSGGSWQTFADGTSSDTSVIVTGLSNGTAYEFQVAASAGGYTGDNSTTATATPSVTARGNEAVLTTGINNNGLSATAEVIPTDVTVGSGFTVEMWVYPQNLDHTWNTLLYQHSSSATITNYDRFGMNIRGGSDVSDVGQVQVILDASNAASPGNDILNYQKSGAVVGTDEWTHVALVVKYLEARKFSAEVFINGAGLGIVEKTTSNDLSSPAKGQFRMGFNPAFSGREFDGHIDQFKVWDVAFTEAQIAASKSAYSVSDSTPPLSDLRVHHDFNALDGSDVDEVSGDGTYDLAVLRSPTVPDEVGVSISSQPSNATVSPGNSAAVSVTAGAGSAEPTTLSYQWQQDTGSGFSDIAGATSASYTSPTLATSDSGIKYRAVITSSIAYEIETITTSEATITVAKTSQTVNSGSIGNQTYGDAITVTANPTSGLTPTFATSTPAVCTIDSATGELTAISVGTCTVTADQAGDETYSAATQESESFTISAKPITVAVTVADKVYNAETTATVSSGVLSGVVSGDTVSFVAANASAAFGTAAVASGKSVTVTLDGDELSGADAGNYSLTVSGSPTASITKKPITVNVTPAGKTYDGTQSVSSFTTSLSGVESGDTVSVDSGEVSVLFDAPGAGTQTATATVTSSVLTGADAGNYSASVGTVSSAVIAKASQATLSFTSASSVVFGQTLTLVATGGSGSGSITYGASGDCTISGGVITPTGAGSCSVTATRATDSNYSASNTASQTVTISKANQSINFTSTVPVSAVSGTTYTPTATASSALTVSFSITTGDGTVCSLSSGVVTFAQSGTCVITASQAGDTDYNAASSVTQTIVAGKINQTITFPAIAGKDFDDPAFAAGATVSTGRTVTYATSTSSVCAVDSSTGVVSIKTIGDCTVTASSAGDASYAAASDVSRTFTISPVLAGKPSVTSVSFGDSSVTVAFVAPGFVGGDAVDGYQVVATSSGGSVTKPDCSTTSPCTITGLTNGDAYTLTVAAINAAGVGPASAASPSITPARVADAVSGLATTPGDEELEVTWTALTTSQLGGGTFTRYDVYLRVNGGSWGSPVTPDGTNNLATRTTNSYTFTGLTNGTAYDVKIVAITSVNSTALSSNTATALGVPATVPDAPTGLVVASLSNTTALASWTAPADDGGDSISAYSVNLSCTFVNATDTFCTLSGLTAGARVTVSVGATNLMGTGSTISYVITMPGGSSGSSSSSSSQRATPTVTPTVTTPSAPILPNNRVLPRPAVPTRAPILSSPVPTSPGLITPSTPIRVLIEGRSVTPTTTQQGNSGVSVKAGALEIGVGVKTPSPTSSVRTNPITEAPELVVATGETATLNGKGMLPGSTVQVWLPGANGRELARIPVAADGSISGDVPLTITRGEAPIPVGRQVLQVTGFDEAGNQTVIDTVINIAQGAPAPERLRETDEVPDLQPGQTLATSAGAPEAVTITANAETRQVSIESSEWSFTVTVPEANGTVNEIAPGAPTVQFLQASTAVVDGEGFQPGTRVDIFLFSDPTLLGSFTVAEDGSVSAEIYLDKRFATIGDHTLQIQGVGNDGYVKAANLGVLVEEPPMETTAHTALTFVWWIIAGVILAAVLLVVLVSRRRRLV